MKIKDLRHGQTAHPLQELNITHLKRGTLSIRDARGREYFRQSVTRNSVRAVVGGALGTHTAQLLGPAGSILDTLQFSVDVQTHIRDAGGQFAELLQMLFYTMSGNGEMGSIRWNGQVYRFFVSWLRDHVHTLKGMKYFTAELKEGIDLYRLSQRSDGMIWDNAYRRTPEPNGWDMRFSYDHFIQPFADYTGEFKRIPVENDVEYLFIEGLYYTWKAVADDAWLNDSLDSAIRAMNYSLASPYRYSKKYKLLKRGYTIDTWDFQAAGDAADPMVIDKNKTHFGVMFGDNTGYIAGCFYLAEMLDHVGRKKQAAVFRRRGAEMRRRLNKVSWNGKFFRHHVPEDPKVKRDLGVDESTQVSLSNAYSLNRGLSRDQCAAIIGTYQKLKGELPAGSPGEWYTIYPPFQKGFGDHNAVWQYMNGGVTPIVAGELAHGCFEHGFEDYGVDILRRLIDLGKRHGGLFHCAYTGSMPPPPPRSFSTIDISAQASADFSGGGVDGVPGWTGEGENDLHEMPTGQQTFCGIPFLVPDPNTNGRRGCIGLSIRDGYRPRVQIRLGKTAASIYFLHCVSQTKSTGVGGLITLEYSDGTRHSQYVVRNQNVNGWWLPSAPRQHGRRTVAVAWRGKNIRCPNIGLILFGLDNPHPQKTIERISLESSQDGAMWMVAGITTSDAPANLGDDPISFGIPDNWGAAAVVYALVEGLAGVVDTGVAFDQAALRPRWLAASVSAASAAVKYPASNGYLAYRYRHDAAKKRITFHLTGSGETCRCEALLPSTAKKVVAVMAYKKSLTFKIISVEKSRYATFTVNHATPQTIVVEYSA